MRATVEVVFTIPGLWHGKHSNTQSHGILTLAETLAAALKPHGYRLEWATGAGPQVFELYEESVK